MPTLGYGRFHRLGHLELALPVIVIRVSAREYAIACEEAFYVDLGPATYRSNLRSTRDLRSLF
jgi:hypothetical protein